MKSKLLEQDRQSLIKLNRSLSPEERLVAFYNHSRLLAELSLAGQAGKKQRRKTAVKHKLSFKI